MFNNIGGKIKGLAEIICVIGIIASIYIGMKSVIMIQAVMIIVGGSLISWIGSFTLYGFGELIETAAEMKTEITNIRMSMDFLNSKIQTPPRSGGSDRNITE